jgi:uridine kinase
LDRFTSALSESIRARARPGERTLIGIDGRGGSGKSTLAKDLCDALAPHAAILGVDTFFKPLSEWQPEFGRAVPHLRWEDFHAILQRLRAGKIARYRAYDWRNDLLAGETEVSAPIVLVEGLYAIRQSARDSYDLAIWVEALLDTRMKRVVERDGSEFLERWNREYLPLEQEYIQSDEPWRRADIVIAGAEMPLSDLGRRLLASCTAADRAS